MGDDQLEDGSYRVLFEHAPDPIIVFDQEARVVDANQAAQAMLQMSRGELRSLSYSHLVVSDAELPMPTVERGRVETWRTKDGKPLTVSVFGGLLQLNGRPVVQLIVRTRSESAEVGGPSAGDAASEALPQALARARREADALQARWRSIVEQTFDWVAQVSRQGQILEVNRRNPGCPGAESVGRPVRELVAADTVEALEAAIVKAFDVLQSGYAVTRTLSSGRWSRNYITPVIEDGRATRAFIMSSDITQHHVAQETLERTQRALLDAEHIAGLGSWDWNLQTGEIYWSDGMFRLCGVDRADGACSPDSYIECVHPDDRPVVSKALDAAFSGAHKVSADFRFFRRDGEARHLSAVGEVFSDDEGRPHRFVGAAKDTTDEQRFVDELREREAFLQAIFDNSQNAIIVADDNGNYLSVNKACAELLGRSLEEAHAMNAADLKVSPLPNAAERFRGYVQRGMESGELAIERPSGEQRIALYNAVRVKKDFNLSVLADVTELRQTEAALRRARALDSLGVLAGGIAPRLQQHSDRGHQ